MKALQVRRSVGRLGLARVASALAPATAVRIGPLEYTEVDAPELPGPGLAPRPHPPRRDLRQRPVDDRGPRVDVLRRLGQLPVRARSRGRRPARRRHPRRARTGARPRGARASARRSTAPPRATATTTPTSRPATSSRASRPASAARPAAAGHPTSSPTTPSSTASPTTCPTSGPCSIEPLAGGIHAALPSTRNAGGGRGRRTGRRRARRRHDGPRGRSPGSSATCRRPGSSSAPATPTSSASPGPSVPTTSWRRRSSPAAVRRIVGCHVIGDHLSSGAHATIDAVGSERSIADALGITRPRGRVVMMGMPAEVTVDLTGLWHRETELVGAYTYGTETMPDGRRVRTFDLATDDRRRHRGRALAHGHLRLTDHVDAIAHAAAAGRRGAVKIAFDLRPESFARSQARSAHDAPSRSLARRLARLTHRRPDATPRVRPRRRPLDPAHARLERRGPQPREAAGRPQPRHLPARAAGRRSTTSTARSATPCSTRSTRTRCRRCCSRACS